MGQRNSHCSISPEKLEDLRYVTNFSVDEIKRLYTDFLTECPSGEMTKDRFRRMYIHYYPLGNPSRFVEHTFRTFDTDGNGAINFQEFLCGICVMSKGRPEQKLNWAFIMYDINGDGYITREEMVDILTAVYKMAGSDPKLSSVVSTPETCTDQVFALMDRNRDGRLSLDEFVESARRNPAILPFLAL